MPKRCALGCPPSDKSLHNFPNPSRFPDTFKAWVEVVGGKLDTPEDLEFYKKKIVCDIHFTTNDRNRNNRLNCCAVPSLFLPDLPAVQQSMHITFAEDLQPQVNVVNAVEFMSTEATSSMQTSRTSLQQSKSATSTEILQSLQVSVENAVESMSTETTSSMQFPRTSLQQSMSATSTEILQSLQVSVENAVETTSSMQFPRTYLPALRQSTNTTSAEVLQSQQMNVVNAVESMSTETTSSMQTPRTCNPLLEHNYFKQMNKESTEIHRKYVSKKKTSKSVAGRCLVYTKEIKNLKVLLQRSRKRVKTFKERLNKAEKLNDDTAFKRITKKMTTEAKIFTRMQFTQTHKACAGRRFNLDEKIMSLSLFKKSPKCYSLLSKFFTLPSAKTLKMLLAEIKIKSGCNEVVFEQIKETVSEMSLEDRLCTLVFDEMSITPQVHYESSTDELKGFSDFENNKIADHVLVFLIKGIKANFKQPVAYYLTNNINKTQLKKVIVDVIKKVQSTGLVVLCTICDQGTANVSAINELIVETKYNFSKRGKPWRDDIFEVNKKTIIPLFDVPHLLKGLRNNLLNKDLKYTDFINDNKEKTVKWTYFQNVYAADKCLGELRLLHKLTEEHLIEDKIKKMRVKMAAQVFSHSVAVVTEHLSARGLVHQDCRQLIPFVTLIDNLFDSLNVSTFHVPNGKIYKGCVKKNSIHHQLWQNAIKMFKSVKFIQTKKVGNNIQSFEKSVPTIKNFIRTIQGMQLIWKTLNCNYSFDSMLTRNFNQDPLENFFGNIRSYGARNTAPNSICFEGAFKALLLNNFNSPHANNANCEKDENACLQNMKFFINNKIKCTSDVPETSNELITINQELFAENTYNETDLGQKNYVCGWVLTKCLKNVIRGCRTCKNIIITNEKNVNNDYILAKEYKKGKRWLAYPSEVCESYFNEIQQIVVTTLKRNVPKRKLKQSIKLMIQCLVICPSMCTMHGDTFKRNFENMTINILIYSWCRSINRILSGKLSYDGEDEIKNVAKDYYNKHKHHKNK